MKLIFVSLFILVSGVFATGVSSQTARVSIVANNISTQDLIQEIEKQTDYLFVYNKNEVILDRKVDLDATNQTVAEVLNKAFYQTDIVYAMEGSNIMLMKSENRNIIPRQEDEKIVTGIVTDTKGEAIIGANVSVKGTTTGTITDTDGKFSLNVPNDAILHFSYIGYLEQDVPVGKQQHLKIVLSEDNQVLEEVVVVGYGVQKKVNLAGAVESVNAKTLENRSTNNIGLALQGIAPNLNITPSGGQADDVPKFNIRGETSINGGTPLILVDGIPTDAGDFSRMNGMDIENISVLKDASSAAIYGARAAFGVILVTTKKGKGEKLTVHFNNNFNVRTLTRMPKVVYDPFIQASYKKEMGKPWYDLYTDEEIEYARQRRDDPSLPGTIISNLDPSKYTYLDNTNWFDEVFDNIGTAHSHNLSISGSNSKVSYYLGTEFYQEKGMLKINKDTYNRYNVRSRIEYKPASWLTVGNNTALTYYTYDKPINFYSWLFSTVNSTNTLVPIRNPDGSYTSEGAKVVGTLTEGGESEKKQSNILTQFNVDFELIKDVWNVKADFTARFSNEKINEWDSDKTIPYRDGPNGTDKYLGWSNYAQSSNYNTNYTQFNVYTDLRKTFGIHSLSLLGGYSQEYETYEKFFGKRLDLITDTYPTPELATGEMTVNQNKYAWVVRSAFYRFNYILNDKYILETNGRYDGTSRFPKKDRFGFFPSVSGAWIVSNENFFKPVQNWFNYLKIRASYGSLGNQGIDPNNPNYYPYITTMSAEKVNYLLNGDKPMGVYTPGLVSAGLTWEKVYTINGGIDANLFNNRLMISGDVYRRDTKDMLTVGKTLPNVLGTSEPKINAADMKTRGWEVSITWRDMISAGKKPLNYSARFSLSDSRSFITKFDNPTGYLEDYYVGYEMGEMWGLETVGFFKDQADIDSSADQWDVTSYPGDRPIEPGDLKYKDQDGDKKINKGAWTVDDPGDYKIIGNKRSRYNYSLDLNADWNGFDVRMLFIGVGKKDFYPTGYKFSGIYSAPWGNVLENNLDHWTPENPNGYFPRPKSYLDWGTGDLSEIQTKYMQNAAFLRMKNLTIGYSLPQRWTHSINLQKVRLYFSGENLFEVTKLNKNYDPEGLDDTSHPYQRTFSIGLNIIL